VSIQYPFFLTKIEIHTPCLISKTFSSFSPSGYQVLDKYLKDRKNRTLTHDEIDNIENIVKVLTFTIKQMELIDNETKDWI